MDIYTAQYRYKGDDRLDITVKGGDDIGKTFAPTWEMVNKYKAGTMSEEYYTDLYQNLMNSRWEEQKKYYKTTFDMVAKGKGTVTLVCFCPSGAFCHRVILAEGLDNLGGNYLGEKNISKAADNYVSGNIMDIENGIICHQVNCQGKMAAGLAGKIALKWPNVENTYIGMCSKNRKYKNKNPMLGQTQIVQAGENLYIANLFGQEYYGRTGRYTDYVALRQAMNRLLEWKEAHSAIFNGELPVYFPYKMSCGLAGGDWYLVKSMIRNIFPEATILKK